MKEILKKYYVYFVSIILGIIAAINISVCLYSTKTVDYNITLINDNMINYIYIDDNKQNLQKYENDNLKYDDELGTLSSSGYVSFDIKTSVISKVAISFDNKDDVNITKDGVEQLVDNYIYSSNMSITQIIKSSISTHTFLYFIIFSILIYFCIKFINDIIEKINNDNVKIKDIILFFISNFLIFMSTIYILLAILKTLTLLIIISYTILLIYKIKDNLKLQNVYIILGTIIGLSFVFLIPPFHVPDEAAHFMKSYKMLEKEAKDDNGIGKLDENMYYFITDYEYTSMDSEVKFNGKNYLSQFANNNISNTTIDKSYQNTKVASFVPYIPSAIIIHIGKNLSFSPLILFILGRTINLLISFILCYLTLCTIPNFKKIFFIIMLFPTFIQQSIGINMDSITNAIAILIVGYFIKFIYQREKISIKQLSIIFILGFILSFCKFGYFPIMFLGLLIPAKKIKVKKISPALVKIFLVFFVLIISYLNTNGALSSTTSIESPYYSISYIINNPFNTIRIFMKTILNRFDTDIFKGYFDSYGTYTKYSNNLFVTFLIAMYSIILLTNDDNKKLSIKERLIYLIVSCMLIGIPYITMFLCWTKVGFDTIDGLQPRYFLIATLLLCIALSSDILNIKFKNKNLLYTTCIIISFMISLYTITIGFY